ncbi:hypothetical protein [Streptomyces sp. NPDC060035]|uniref:hypothetical protein n=1 Tax=Streptomyces sp. NPDC060035 TaxID=3347044 RepID=UPI00367C5F42
MTESDFTDVVDSNPTVVWRVARRAAPAAVGVRLLSVSSAVVAEETGINHATAEAGQLTGLRPVAPPTAGTTRHHRPCGGAGIQTDRTEPAGAAPTGAPLYPLGRAAMSPEVAAAVLFVAALACLTGVAIRRETASEP